jgi:hypothetical protein
VPLSDEEALYQPLRLYYADRDALTPPLWLGSALKFLGRCFG